MSSIKRLLPCILCVAVILNPGFLFAQLTLPNKKVIKDSSVLRISVTKHDLPNQPVNVSNQAKTTIEKEPYLWATYWFNKNGMPDSMNNYMDGVAYRSEAYTYDKKGVLIMIEVVNEKGEITWLKKVSKLSKGNTLYSTMVKRV